MPEKSPIHYLLILDRIVILPAMRQALSISNGWFAWYHLPRCTLALLAGNTYIFAPCVWQVTFKPTYSDKSSLVFSILHCYNRLFSNAGCRTTPSSLIDTTRINVPRPTNQRVVVAVGMNTSVSIARQHFTSTLAVVKPMLTHHLVHQQRLLAEHQHRNRWRHRK